MSLDHSCIAVIPVALLDKANRLWWAQGLDSAPSPGTVFTIMLGEAEEGPVTCYGLHGWQNIDTATAWLLMPTAGGTIPPLVHSLQDAGLTEQDAIDVCLAADPRVATLLPGDDRGTVGMQNFNAMCAARGLVRIFE